MKLQNIPAMIVIIDWDHLFTVAFQYILYFNPEFRLVYVNNHSNLKSKSL
jgi:hypothetical protein